MTFRIDDTGYISGYLEFKSPSKALDHAVTPRPYICDTDEEKTAYIAEQTVSAMGRLMDILHEKNILSNEEVVTILGYGWSVAPNKEF